MASRAQLSLVMAGVLAVSTAAASPGQDPSTDRGNSGDVIVAPPPAYKANGVTVTEHLGAKLPLDAYFKDHDGKLVKLGDVIAPGDGVPTILTFNYADCPMLCNQQLTGLVAGLPGAAAVGPLPGAAKDIGFVLGEHYRIVTIMLEPAQELHKTQRMRSFYLERAKAPEKAWTFLSAALPNDGSQIQRVADAVGFSYVYLSDRLEWAHPAAFIFLSSTGTITRYVYGIELPAPVFRESIYKAGLAEPATAAGFMFRCYHYDPSANDHSRSGLLALRIGAASCVLLLAGFGIALSVSRRRKAREVS
jgi:protein SCO1